ncbi:MAG: peroxiredoxin [Verrucomicrobiota bacterium]|jgi:thioredoxin-dependent peroxiredoxin
MKITLFLAALVVAGVFLTATKSHADMPKAGDTAPLFTGVDQDGKDFKLADHVGKKIVLLYFYPKDFTGGCTKEACGLRDRMGDLSAANVEVIGVSHDSVDSHKKFADQYKLNFTLIADPDGKIIATYDTKMPVMPMSKRVSFLIGPDGKIIHVTNAMSPQTHFDEMKAAIDGLKKN